MRLIKKFTDFFVTFLFIGTDMNSVLKNLNLKIVVFNMTLITMPVIKTFLIFKLFPILKELSLYLLFVFKFFSRFCCTMKMYHKKATQNIGYTAWLIFESLWDIYTDIPQAMSRLTNETQLQFISVIRTLLLKSSK